jgi:hypothetical protein
MMRVIPIDFLGQGAMLEPRDVKLHDLAVEYCRKELQGGDELDLTKFNKVWVAVETDGESYVQVHGLTGWINRIDIPVFRATSEEAVNALAERINTFCSDNGCRGQEIFIHISKREKPEQRCPAWKETLTAWDAKSADRVLVKVR